LRPCLGGESGFSSPAAREARRGHAPRPWVCAKAVRTRSIPGRWIVLEDRQGLPEGQKPDCSKLHIVWKGFRMQLVQRPNGNLGGFADKRPGRASGAIPMHKCLFFLEFFIQAPRRRLAPVTSNCRLNCTTSQLIANGWPPRAVRGRRNN
jgi:hypothetical protein